MVLQRLFVKNFDVRIGCYRNILQLDGGISKRAVVFEPTEYFPSGEMRSIGNAYVLD